MWKVERNHCSCHPETCCCDPWKVVDEHGETVAKFYHRKDAEKLPQALDHAVKFSADSMKGRIIEKVKGFEAEYLKTRKDCYDFELKNIYAAGEDACTKIVRSIKRMK